MCSAVRILHSTSYLFINPTAASCRLFHTAHNVYAFIKLLKIPSDHRTRLTGLKNDDMGTCMTTARVNERFSLFASFP
jgi:hypothetical protein